ncbi:MAG TPA: c-type cytochrome [Egibacteraceae bacterium]|nr:c-type cytochrome [Actinomycetota bacterium]HWB72020.1 c-type cytochrome [Egibacteraceae bacterium]
MAATVGKPRRLLGWVAVGGLLLLSCTQVRLSEAPPPAAEGGQPERGRHLIAHYGCGACHTIPGVPEAKGRAAPPLISFGQRAFIAGNLPNTPENLARWIMNPQEVEPGTAMPNLNVTEEDAVDIAAYLESLQ